MARCCRALAKLLCAGALLALAGCGTEAIIVSDGALVNKVDYQWILSTRTEPRTVFYPDDEKVTLSVRFEYNLRATYEWYRVEWIEPTGKPYKVVSTRTEFGSHRDLQASIKIRGKMAAKLPGLWRVRLYHLDEEGNIDRLLYARMFRIAAAPSAETSTAAVPAPEDPLTRPPTASRLSTPLGAETGIAQATLSADQSETAPAPTKARAPARVTAPTPATAPAPTKTVAKPRPGARRYAAGCPPLYYPPDEGCIEEAPEE